ncbi:MAG: hypothetical protein PWQ93_1180 [Clostridiales bacterium]|nr:hypothetical protein [Clostridiales bacterium]
MAMDIQNDACGSVSCCCQDEQIKTTDCMVCGHPLIYSSQPIVMACSYCGKEQQAYIFCPDGHYVCDECHAKDSLTIIKEYCIASTTANPMELAETIMADIRIPMHGPEHHALVPAVLVAAYRNLTGKVSDNDIEQALERGSGVPGGACGYYGACGAAVGLGVAVSVIFKATPLTPLKRSHANRITARALDAIADDGGARCCKRAVRRAIEQAVIYFKDELNIEFPLFDSPHNCIHSVRNRECLARCVYKN